MNGPEFLFLYSSLLVLGLLGMLLWRAAMRRTAIAANPGALRPRDVGYLAGGPARSSAVMVLEGPDVIEEVPLPAAATVKDTDWQATARARLIPAAGGSSESVIDRLEAHGLVVPRRTLAQQRWWGSLWFFGLGLFGAVRVVQGVSAGKPVLYLLGLLVVTGGAWWWATRRRALVTVHGERHLRELRAVHPLGATEPVLAFALYGWVALAGLPALEGLLAAAGHTPQTAAAVAGGCGATGCATGCTTGDTTGWSGGDSGGGDSGGGDGGGGCGGCGGD